MPASSWCSGGADLPYARLPTVATSIALARGRGVRLRPVYARAFARHEPAARIPVERISGRVLLISGGRDCVWPATDLAGMSKSGCGPRATRAHRSTWIIRMPGTTSGHRYDEPPDHTPRV